MGQEGHNGDSGAHKDERRRVVLLSVTNDGHGGGFSSFYSVHRL